MERLIFVFLTPAFMVLINLLLEYLLTELGQSLSDFGKAIKLLGSCEGDSLGKVFSELGSKSELLSIKLQKEVTVNSLVILLTCKDMLNMELKLWD